MKKLAVLAVAVLFAACQPDNPTVTAPEAENLDLPTGFNEVTSQAALDLLREAMGPPIPLAKAIVGEIPEGLELYDNRTVFGAFCPTLPVEDFEGSRVPDGGVRVCPGPLSSATDDDCYAPNAVLDGFSLAANLGYATLAPGFAGTASTVVGPNFFVDNTTISFTEATGVGFDLRSVDGGLASIEVFDEGGASLGSFSTTSTTIPGPGAFVGIRADATIGSILISNALGELIDNLAFGLCYIPITIDIKPGSDPNSINIDADDAVVTVAILSTPDFDATSVDHTTLLFEGVPEIHVDKKTDEARRHEEDVNGDGLTDLLMHVRVGDTGFDQSSTEGTLTGSTFDGRAIQGTDAVVPIWQVAHVSGGGIMTWTVDNEFFTVFGNEQYGFNAKQFSDGSVQGQLQTDWEETGGPRLHMALDCLDVQGNQAYVGGTVTNVTEGGGVSVGQDFIFWIEDNGQGADADPDRMSFFFLTTNSAVCANPNVQSFIYDLFVVQQGGFATQTAGNIQVKGS